MTTTTDKVHELRVRRSGDVALDGAYIGNVSVRVFHGVIATDPRGRRIVENADSRATAAFLLAVRTGRLFPGERFAYAGAVARPGGPYTVAEHFDPVAIGTRVRAAYPNESWGEGVVEYRVASPAHKPYVVRRDDGTVGYFHPDQIEEV